MFIRKKIIKKLTAFCLAASMLMAFTACESTDSGVKPEEELEEDVTINLWYADPKFTSYFEECAAVYHEANEHVTIELKRIDDDNYFNDIYNACVRTDNVTDIFMMSSDDVQKAYLMGLMKANTSYPDVYNEQVYGKTAVTSASYGGKLLGYPLTFETSVMVYNKKFAGAMKTFEEITAFSDNFQHTEENETVTQVVGWDVSDIALNYAFLGAYMNVGGDAADDVAKTYLQDDKLKEAINAFAGFKNSYGIVRDNPQYSTYLTKFMEGSLLYTIVRTDDLAAINASGVEYGIMAIPDYSANLKTKAVSETYMLAVTPYSSHPKVAESVAKAFTYDYAGNLNEKASVPAARTGLDNQPQEYGNLHSVYSDTAIKARYMEISDYYMNMEIMLHQVWDESASVDDAYGKFKDYVMTTMSAATKTSK